MRFTVGGESFELTAELVRTRLAAEIPEPIQEYWVEIDGKRWPVKQVISIATGISNRQRFQSQDSRRWLRNLGFTIGSESDGVAVSGRRARGQFDASQLKQIDSVDVRVSFSWLEAGNVVLDPNGFPQFPPLPRSPGLYRYDFGTDSGGFRTLYIGESMNLAKRATNYRNAKKDRTRQRTSRRIHRELVSHLNAGGTVEFAIAVSVRRDTADELDLRLKSARRLAENAAVLLAQSQPKVRVLNIDAELSEDESTSDRTV